MDFHQNIFGNPCWVADHGIGQPEHRWCWREGGDVQLIEDNLGHNAYACPKATQGMIKLLGAN